MLDLSSQIQRAIIVPTVTSFKLQIRVQITRWPTLAAFTGCSCAGPGDSGQKPCCMQRIVCFDRVLLTDAAPAHGAALRLTVRLLDGLAVAAGMLLPAMSTACCMLIRDMQAYRPAPSTWHTHSCSL